MDIAHAVQAAQRRDKAVEERLGQWHYLRFANKSRPFSIGTAVFDGEVIWSYPSIGRLLQLESGLRQQFDAPFWVEEKVDGYNVRVFKHGGDVLALTRRGYICPFTTDRLPDLLDLSIFDQRPDIVLCTEVAGPENPYNEAHPPYVTEDVRLFVFDMMRKNTPGFLPYEERTRLMQAYDLPGVTTYGRYRASDVAELKALLRTLDQEGKEGVVFKEDSERGRRAKYVTSQANLNDIRATAMGLLQLPPEYYTQRLLRLVLFLDEEGIEGTQALYADLGEAMIEGVHAAIRQYKQHQQVFQTFRCRFRQRANALLLVEALTRLLGAAYFRQRRLEPEGDFYVLEFDKVLPRESETLGNLLRGGLTFD
jgi:putative ATP-dependent DNA ligase